MQVTTNLIEAYELLMEFVAKNTSDKFCLIDNVNTSIRGIISREVIANIGRTDMIGSGVRNLYKYTPIYSDGGKPELIEDDVFRDYAKIKKVTGAMYDKKTSTWTL